MNEKDLRKLLSDMSLEEKIGEMHQMPGQFYSDKSPVTGVNSRLKLSQRETELVGSAINVRYPEFIINVQKEHIEKHPHHIPMLFMLDIIHGYGTTFPIPLAQACSFDTELVGEMAKATAKESCVAGQHVTFSPMVDLCRDARWGRVMEGYGEDPYLNSVMAETVVKGYQGDDLSKEGTISACVKHFAAYGAVESGREYNTVDVSERTLRQYHFPSYKAACDAKSAMLMTAFISLNGVPATGNKWLLKDVLRDEWQYDGVVITDYGSINTMQGHSIDYRDDKLAKLALDSAVDIEMCVGRYRNAIPQLLESGEITMEQIDNAVWRILCLKNRLGLFENPYRFADPEKAKEIINCKEHLDLAQKAVSECSVLLKNDDKILPLDSAKGNIALIGPFVECDRILGGWSLYSIDHIPIKTVGTAIKERYPNMNLNYAKGSWMLGVENSSEAILQRVFESGVQTDEAQRKADIAKAVEAAKKSDTVIMCLGEHPSTGGELTSKMFLEIPAIQQELFDAVSAVNDNIVVVLFNHRPLDLRRISKAKAILNVWYPGIMGAEGIVDMLFGTTAPTGRITMSFPYSVGQCPIYYNCLPTDHSAEFLDSFITKYLDGPIDPLYKFGQGLTYTDFEYGELKLSKDKIGEGETLKASITVKNVGERDGVETVQMYLRDRWASVSRPYKELKGFKRVEIKAGETVEVEFEINPDMLRFYNANMEYVWEPGETWVYIGHDSTVQDHKTFELV